MNLRGGCGRLRVAGGEKCLPAVIAALARTGVGVAPRRPLRLRLVAPTAAAAAAAGGDGAVVGAPVGRKRKAPSAGPPAVGGVPAAGGVLAGETTEEREVRLLMAAEVARITRGGG